MICTVCGDALPEPAPTGQRLTRKCKRHYVEVGTIVLAMHRSGSLIPRTFTVERVAVTARQGNGFSYRVVDSINDPFYTGQCRLMDEGVWWSCATDDESAGALRATYNLGGTSDGIDAAVEDLMCGGYYR